VRDLCLGKHLDEAHHAAPSGGARYAISSQLTRAVNDLAHRFEHRLFLTATPRNGHSNSFSALLEMLDPQRFTRGVQRFARGVEVRPRDLEPVMVRRLKSDLRRLGEAFPERTVERISIAGLSKDAPELDLWQKLADYGELRSRRVGKLHLCACERNSLKQFTKEAETARSPYNRSVIGAPIGRNATTPAVRIFAVF